MSPRQNTLRHEQHALRMKFYNREKSNNLFAQDKNMSLQCFYKQIARESSIKKCERFATEIEWRKSQKLQTDYDW